MSENAQLIICIIFFVILFFLGILLKIWLARRTALRLIKHLIKNGALDSGSAMELSFTKKGLMAKLGGGLRDYRTQALDQLVKMEIIKKTEFGRYYLAKDPSLFK